MQTLHHPHTLADALAAVLERFRALVEAGVRSPATLAMHEDHVRWILEGLDGRTALEAVDETCLDAWAAREARGRRMRQDGSARTLSPGSIRKRWTTLALAFRLARRRRLIERIPEPPDVEYRYQPRQAHLKSFADYRALFLALPRHRAEWVAVAVFTGQHASDVNTMRAFVDADPFGAEPWIRIRNTKNRRTVGLRVPMPPELVRVLGERFRRERISMGQPVVQAWPHGSRNHTLPKTALKLGLGRINANALRHTTGTWMVRRKGFTKAAAEVMGHSSLDMLARVYAHALPLQLHEMIAELASVELEGEPRKGPHKVSSPDGPAEEKKVAAGGETPATTNTDSEEAHSSGSAGVPRVGVEPTTHGFSECDDLDPDPPPRPPPLARASDGSDPEAREWKRRPRSSKKRPPSP